MIYICADDYGISNNASENIRDCIEKSAIKQVSVLPNFNTDGLNSLIENKNIRLSLHLNFVEGKCMADSDQIDLIADTNGNFKNTFGGLLKLSLFRPKEFEAQIYKEIRAQMLFWKSILPKDAMFCIDSHQHTHMIPAIFRALVKVVNDENITLNHMRIPAEPILPYIQTPSLYFKYNPINIVKQWLLKFLWLINKSTVPKNSIPTSLFFGILFSGKMDEKRVIKILPKFEKLADKGGKNIEVLFHPGGINKKESDLKEKNIIFKRFYLSSDRKKEFESVIRISERSVK